MPYIVKNRVKYWVADRSCLYCSCLVLGMYQHRSPLSGGGSRNTGSSDTPTCLTNAYRGCPTIEKRGYSPVAAKERRKEGMKVTL